MSNSIDERMTDFIPQNSWPRTDRAKQFLLFAIRLKELVHPDAQDIYRVHAVSSIGKITELETCCKDVLSKRYAKAALQHIIDEVNECIGSDPIIKKIIRSKRLPEDQIRFHKDRNTEAILSLARLWLQLIEDKYETVLKEEILTALSEVRLKKKLLICTKLFVSHLLHRGIHRDFILEHTEATFFSSDIGQCTDKLVRRFFESFDPKKKKYSIILTAEEPTASVFREGSHLGIADTAEKLEEQIGCKLPEAMSLREDQKAIIVRGVEASNPYEAFNTVSMFTSLPEVFGVIYPSPEKLRLDDQFLVVDEKEKSPQTISRTHISATVHSYTSKIRYSQEMFTAFASYLWSVTENRDQDTFNRLNRSLEAAKTSLETTSATAQLVSLWSAMEALLPPPTNDEKGVRIVHFVDFIVPCVSRKYLRGKFRIFIDDVSRHSAGNILPLLGENVSRVDRPQALAKLLMNESAERKHLFTELNDSPLLLQRLFELGKLVEDPAKVKTKQEAHEQRVTWQLHRIYRERNMIVHSGHNSDYLPVLVENLFLYFRLVIRALQQMHSKFSIYQPDGALELVAALHKQKMKRLDAVLRDTSSRDFHTSFLNAIFDD